MKFRGFIATHAPLLHLALTIALAALLVSAFLIPGFLRAKESPFTQDFVLDPSDLKASGSNPYFILEPGHQLILEGNEGGKSVRLVITVLNETRLVAGVGTRIVEERETWDGVLAEVSRNYFAVSERTNSVYYFGEAVDIYEQGELVSHDGSWEAGTDGYKAGLMMPGTPLLGARYYQEIAPGVAMDRAEIMSLTADVVTPAGSFDRCLETREDNPLERGAVEYKFYTVGIGIVVDGVLELVSHGDAW